MISSIGSAQNNSIKVAQMMLKKLESHFEVGKEDFFQRVFLALCNAQTADSYFVAKAVVEYPLKNHKSIQLIAKIMLIFVKSIVCYSSGQKDESIMNAIKKAIDAAETHQDYLLWATLVSTYYHNVYDSLKGKLATPLPLNGELFKKALEMTKSSGQYIVWSTLASAYCRHVLFSPIEPQEVEAAILLQLDLLDEFSLPFNELFHIPERSKDSFMRIYLGLILKLYAPEIDFDVQNSSIQELTGTAGELLKDFFEDVVMQTDARAQAEFHYAFLQSSLNCIHFYDLPTAFYHLAMVTSTSELNVDLKTRALLLKVQVLNKLVLHTTMIKERRDEILRDLISASLDTRISKELKAKVHFFKAHFFLEWNVKKDAGFKFVQLSFENVLKCAHPSSLLIQATHYYLGCFRIFGEAQLKIDPKEALQHFDCLDDRLLAPSQLLKICQLLKLASAHDKEFILSIPSELMDIRSDIVEGLEIILENDDKKAILFFDKKNDPEVMNSRLDFKGEIFQKFDQKTQEIFKTFFVTELNIGENSVLLKLNLIKYLFCEVKNQAFNRLYAADNLISFLEKKKRYHQIFTEIILCVRLKQIHSFVFFKNFYNGDLEYLSYFTIKERGKFLISLKNNDVSNLSKIIKENPCFVSNGFLLFFFEELQNKIQKLTDEKFISINNVIIDGNLVKIPKEIKVEKGIFFILLLDQLNNLLIENENSKNNLELKEHILTEMVQIVSEFLKNFYTVKSFFKLKKFPSVDEKINFLMEFNAFKYSMLQSSKISFPKMFIHLLKSYFDLIFLIPLKYRDILSEKLIDLCLQTYKNSRIHTLKENPEFLFIAIKFCLQTILDEVNENRKLVFLNKLNDLIPTSKDEYLEWVKKLIQMSENDATDKSIIFAATFFKIQHLNFIGKEKNAKLLINLLTSLVEDSYYFSELINVLNNPESGDITFKEPLAKKGFHFFDLYKDSEEERDLIFNSLKLSESKFDYCPIELKMTKGILRQLDNQPTERKTFTQNSSHLIESPLQGYEVGVNSKRGITETSNSRKEAERKLKIEERKLEAKKSRALKKEISQEKIDALASKEPIESQANLPFCLIKPNAMKIFEKFWIPSKSLDKDGSLDYKDPSFFRNDVTITRHELEYLICALGGTYHSNRGKGSHAVGRLDFIFNEDQIQFKDELMTLADFEVNEKIKNGQAFTFTKAQELKRYQVRQVREKLWSLGYTPLTVKAEYS